MIGIGKANVVIFLMVFVPLQTASAELQVYNYDFENGTTDWELAPGIWSWTSLEGGHALIGNGHGFVRLTAHSGDISLLRFRFRLKDMQSHLNANLLESFAGGYTRYFVTLGTDGARINKQQGTTIQELGQGLVPVSAGVFYDAWIMVGGGSVDLFIDGKGVLGADDPAPPPPGSVSFESLDNSIVDVDDVEVQIGTEYLPHPRAPRSPFSLPPGQDVGPFIGGNYTGSISLTNNDVLTLSQGRYTLREGEVSLSGNARLHIEKGAVLVFDRGNSPLYHWGINMIDSSVLEVAGGNLVPNNGSLIRINAFGNSSIAISNAMPWIHFINAGENVNVNIDNSSLVTTIGGQVMLSGSTSVYINDSEIGSIALRVPPGGIFHARNLNSGTLFSNFDLQRDFTVSQIGYNLRMNNVTLIPDTLGEGPLERGWIIFADENSTTRINDSVLHKIIVSLQPSGADVVMDSLRLNQTTNLTVGGGEFNNVIVTGQWGFNIRGSRRASFYDSEGLWFFLYDDADVLLHNSTMNEFDPRNFRGNLTFENSEWKVAGEIIEGNDFLMTGTVNIDPELRNSLSWSQSVVTRNLPILVQSPDGKPAPGVTINLTRQGNVFSTTTDSTGKASVELRFTDQDFTQPWQLTTSLPSTPLSINFFNSTPIIVRERNIIARYDADGDGRIERNEAVKAVLDFFMGLIHRQDAVAVVIDFFGS